MPWRHGRGGARGAVGFAAGSVATAAGASMGLQSVRAGLATGHGSGATGWGKLGHMAQSLYSAHQQTRAEHPPGQPCAAPAQQDGIAASGQEDGKRHAGGRCRCQGRIASTPLTAGPGQNPYLNGREEWLERYGNYIKRAAQWRMMAVFCLLLAAGSVAANVIMAAQYKVVPYIVEVDRIGQAAAVSRADLASPAPKRLIQAELGQRDHELAHRDR